MDHDLTEAAEGFSESWLALREPADHLSRNREVNDQLVSWFKQQETHQILELGAGTGSNLRYMMPQLGHDQRWKLLDNDAALFSRLPELLQRWAEAQGARFVQENKQCLIEHDSYSATVDFELLNLATRLDQLVLDNVQLLTASALLDLTSAKWLDNIAERVTDNGCACLFTLNYNGDIQWHPELAADNHVRTLLNEHQLNDKGFGFALGPEAFHHFSEALQRLGRRVTTGFSPWVIEPQSHELQIAIIDGWAHAAVEQEGSSDALISTWHTMRRQSIDQRLSTLTVGHVDVLSLP